MSVAVAVALVFPQLWLCLWLCGLALSCVPCFGLGFCFAALLSLWSLWFVGLPGGLLAGVLVGLLTCCLFWRCLVAVFSGSLPGLSPCPCVVCSLLCPAGFFRRSVLCLWFLDFFAAALLSMWCLWFGGLLGGLLVGLALGCLICCLCGVVLLRCPLVCSQGCRFGHCACKSGAHTHVYNACGALS